MTKLTREEREAFASPDRSTFQQPELEDPMRLVLPTPQARLEYIRFATEASRFFRGRREVGFCGENWLL